MKYEQQRAVEMTGYGKRGKPKAGFPSFPTALGNRKRRDSHIPTAPARRGKVENQTQVSHFPACCFYFSRKGDPAIASLRFRLILRLEYALGYCTGVHDMEVGSGG